MTFSIVFRQKMNVFSILLKSDGPMDSGARNAVTILRISLPTTIVFNVLFADIKRLLLLEQCFIAYAIHF